MFFSMSTTLQSLAQEFGRRTDAAEAAADDQHVALDALVSGGQYLCCLISRVVNHQF